MTGLMQVRGRVAAVVLAAMVAGSAWAATSDASIDPTLRSAVQDFARAFVAAEPKAFAAWFTPDGTMIIPTGETAQGRAAIEKLFGVDVPTFKGAPAAINITGVRRLGPDLVWIDADLDVPQAHDRSGGTFRLNPHMVLLAKRSGREWKWVEVRAFLFQPRGSTGPAAPASTRP